jgi:16S rRNA processing protein RimM
VLVGGKAFELERVWYHKDQPIFKFKGVDSIGAAEALAGLEVTIPETERFPLSEDEYFLSDLVGWRMVEDSSGREVGTVTSWQETGGPVLLEVDGGRVLVPFARSILKKLDPLEREIRVDLPEGLEKLNA